MSREELLQKLFSLRDPVYQSFQARILPNIPAESIIGARTPELRQIAKSMDDSQYFLSALPHTYFEENQIHAFLLSEKKDFDETIQAINSFLPYIDNWSTCDQLSPKVFRKHHSELLPYIQQWLHSTDTYAIRFAIKVLMDHFLEEDFSPEHPDWVASVHSEEYYIRMVIAWYFATALAKQYDAVYPYLTGYRLEKWIHNKTIQKAVESFRISQTQKEQLKKLRIR